MSETHGGDERSRHFTAHVLNGGVAACESSRALTRALDTARVSATSQHRFTESDPDYFIPNSESQEASFPTQSSSLFNLMLKKNLPEPDEQTGKLLGLAERSG